MRRAEVALLAALLAAHLAASWWSLEPGHLSVDECTYHLMVKSLADHGELRFRNGYEEFPSIELVLVTLQVSDGHLYPVTPPGYAVLAWPFYRVAGYPGLFALNNLAFLATLALAGALAWRLFRNRALALVAVLVLGLATFLWEYSQAAWPHALSTFLVLAAFSAAWQGTRAASERKAFAWCLLAGTVAGLGVGVRLDVALALPCLAVLYLFGPPRRLAAALGIALGALPSFVALSIVNSAKFGMASPLSYGTKMVRSGDWTHYLPVAALGLLVLLGCRLAVSPRLRARMGGGLRWLGLGALALALLLLLPAVRELLERLVVGSAQLVWDLRWLPPEHERPALARSAGGGLVYFGHLKKSLLQSCPYLALLLGPAWAALRGHGDRGQLAALALVPGAFLAAYGYFAWDGGMVLNLRYLAPALPFLAILTAWALCRVYAGLAPRHPVPWGVAWATALLWWLWVRPHSAAVDVIEPRLLGIPQVLAGLTAAAALALSVRGERAGPRLRVATAALAAAGLTWACAVAFSYDAPASRSMRAFNLDLSDRAVASVDEKSIVFTTRPDPYCGLLESDDVYLALPLRDRFEDFRPLIDFYLARDRAVYGAFPPSMWRGAARRGWLEGLEVEQVWEHPVFTLGRIRRK